jgi:hypothetical protein
MNISLPGPMKHFVEEQVNLVAYSSRFDLLFEEPLRLGRRECSRFRPRAAASCHSACPIPKAYREPYRGL